ncbi:hypothetical protein ACQP2X_15015 [Actinoplanes sp. CA-131856]
MTETDELVDALAQLSFAVTAVLTAGLSESPAAVRGAGDDRTRRELP